MRGKITMETLMTLFVITLCYRNTKANATELSERFAGDAR